MAIVHVKTKEEFQKEVEESKKPVIVDFWAPWCMPCKMLGPVFEKVSEDNTDVVFVKINVDEAGELASKFNVASIPTILFFKEGKNTAKSVGALSKQQLEDFVNENK